MKIAIAAGHSAKRANADRGTMRVALLLSACPLEGSRSAGFETLADAAAAGTAGAPFTFAEPAETGLEALPAGALSTWRLVRMPYSTATTPHAMAIKSRFIVRFFPVFAAKQMAGEAQAAGVVALLMRRASSLQPVRNPRRASAAGRRPPFRRAVR